MKPIRPFCLVLVLTFIAGRCEKGVAESRFQNTQPIHPYGDDIGNPGLYDYIRLSVDPKIHNDYGLAYPVTYQFSIPGNSSNLKAYKRYSKAQAWSQITEKTANDFFNGIKAARFDNSSDRVYVSVAFSDTVLVRSSTGKFLFHFE